MNPFTQWIDGQPWWVTLLLLPVEVLAGVAVRVVRYAAAALGVLAAAGIAALVWSRRRR